MLIDVAFYAKRLLCHLFIVSLSFIRENNLKFNISD